MQPGESQVETQGPSRVTVILTSRDCEDALRRCLKSVEESAERARVDVIVVDLASRDGSAQVDSEFATVTVLRLPRNFGQTRARNIATRSATTEYIFFLDPHVELERQTIASLLKTLDARDDLVGAAPQLFDSEDGAPVGMSAALPLPEALFEASRENRWLVPAQGGVVRDLALMVRRPFLTGMRFLDEKRYSHFWAELELAYQAAHAGKKIEVIEAARGKLHPADSGPDDPGSLALLSADRFHGAAAYIGKHAGFGAELLFRVRAGFYALGKSLTFQQPAYHFKLLTALIGGQRIDGTQGGPLG